jgi:O-acetyl-ADP-ribose deacetylase (regulator of RNase III)
MSFTEVTGDLFDMDLPAIGHGVNCVGIMGAGIARVFRDKYPDMFAAYKIRCAFHRLHPGQVMSWNAGNQMILNLATQFYPGADATLGDVDAAVKQALRFCEKEGIASLGLPRIGSGIGGLRWEDVRKIMKDAAEASPVTLVVVSLPEQP